MDELQAAFALVQSAKTEIATRVGTQDNVERNVDQLLTQIAAYVESIAGKDDTVITSAAMEPKGSRSSSTLPTAPQAVSATTGEHEGEMVLSWKAVPKRSQLRY